MVGLKNIRIDGRIDGGMDGEIPGGIDEDIEEEANLTKKWNFKFFLKMS